MAVANLNDSRSEVLTGNDNIVIVDNFQSVRGGRTLDVAGYPKDVLNAGHVIIKETATGEYKPMPLAATNAIISVGTVTGGSSYVDATYEDVELTSAGNGTGAKATIVVAAGAVKSVVITTPGTGYSVGDTLSANNSDLGGAGSGFSVTVTSVDDEPVLYAGLPGGHTYAGILIATILTKKPFAGILVRGTVNPAAAPFPMGTILTAVKAALPLIDFRED